MPLKTTYKNAIPSTPTKIYNVKSSGGDVLLEEVVFDDQTSYTQEGDTFGATDINETNTQVNANTQSIEDIGEILGDVTVEDLNNLSSGSGWTPVIIELTYASADSPTFVVNTSTDITSKISVGMKLKLTQSTVKYFIVTAIDSYTITLYGGTDYTLLDETITNAYFSSVKAPFGFPISPEKWTVTATTELNLTGTPTNNTWWNPSNYSITIPIGLWNVSRSLNPRGHYILVVGGYYNIYWTLSTTNNSSTLSQFDAQFGGDIVTAGNYTNTNAVFSTTLYEATSKTVLYLLHKGLVNGSLGDSNGFMRPTIIKAVCAYL